MHRRTQHAPVVTPQPISVVPEGRRAPHADDLANRSTGPQPAALVSLVRTLARQAAADVLRTHGVGVSTQVTPKRVAKE